MSANTPSSETGVAVIDLESLSACVYWVERLGVTEEELKAAVEAVGSHPDDVLRFLTRFAIDHGDEVSPSGQT